MPKATASATATSCTACKYVFIFAFTALLSLFVASYVLRIPKAENVTTKPFDQATSVDGASWQTRIDELKNTADGKTYSAAQETL